MFFNIKKGVKTQIHISFRYFLLQSPSKFNRLSKCEREYETKNIDNKITRQTVH